MNHQKTMYYLIGTLATVIIVQSAWYYARTTVLQNSLVSLRKEDLHLRAGIRRAKADAAAARAYASNGRVPVYKAIVDVRTDLLELSEIVAGHHPADQTARTAQ